jgi:HEAT repeat protein
MEDNDLNVVNEAAIALSQLRAKASVRPLIRALSKGAAAGNRSSAAWTLGTLRTKAALSALLKVLTKRDESPQVRAEAADALGGVGDRKAFPELVEALGDPEPQVRFWAAYALGNLGDRRAIPHLKRLLSDTTVVPGWWSIGKEAADAIETITTNNPDDSHPARGHPRRRKRRS